MKRTKALLVAGFGIFILILWSFVNCYLWEYFLGINWRTAVLSVVTGAIIPGFLVALYLDKRE